MEPKSLSATSLHVAELCLSRWEAEHYHRGRTVSGDAATLGSTVHGALENFVKACYLEKAKEPSLKLLIDFYKMSFIEWFGSIDADSTEYNDGLEMLMKWFNRTSFEGVRVISCEQKDHFELPTSIGNIPFNYIWDRFDQIGEREFRVVDYKSSKWNINSDDLKKKIQPRAYGLAAAIQLRAQNIPYDQIWVQFDMLRHNTVGIVFTRQDNLVTWNRFIETAERIIATPEDEAPETLNSECLFCVKKISCDAVKRNIMVGGIHTLGSAEEAVDLRAQLDWQKKAVTAALKELDTFILTDAKEKDATEFESADNRMKIGVKKTRKIDPEMAEKAIGEDVFRRHGGKSITIGEVDKLLKGKEITPEQKSDLRSLIYYESSEPSVKSESKSSIDE